MAGVIYMDSFSGAASNLKGKQRTPLHILAVLAKSPRVSRWDMADHAWLRSGIAELKKQGLLVEDDKEPYPWYRYVLTVAGHKALEPKS